MGTREKISLIKVSVVAVDVKAWDFDVYVRRPGLRRALRLEDLNAQQGEGTAKPDEVMAAVVAATMCEADGAYVFDPANEGDIEFLLEQDPEALKPVFEAGLVVAGNAGSELDTDSGN